MQSIASSLVHVAETKGRSYGDSWKQRGGVGAFMMLARKWDRIENMLQRHYGYDILKALEDFRENPDNCGEDIRDTIEDLIVYLLLCLTEDRQKVPKAVASAHQRAQDDGVNYEDDLPRRHPASIGD